MGQPIEIRPATLADIPALQDIFAHARTFMRQTGNPHQWASSYPGTDLLRDDIASASCFVVLCGGQVAATFVLRGGADPTYLRIYGGHWLNDAPYATIHRIASNGQVKGVFHLAVQYALRRYSDIRVDTHRDNVVMQRAILKEGFSYCGIIHCWNGTERLAYQYSSERSSDAAI